jgi:glycosyltransferase involved in cell wall biosynthesis
LSHNTGMRLAWFSPMPPVRSGIAACSADLVAGLSADHQIDVFVDEPVVRAATQTGTSLPWRSAHEFIWRNRAAPYDLTVYQVGNSSHHDFLWPYLFRYPGLAVLHDVHLHHARAAALLRTKRPDHYRDEFVANHPGVNPDVAELAIAGFDSHLYYAFPMTRLLVQASRCAAVHSAPLAAALNADIAGARVTSIRLGHGTFMSDADVAAARATTRAERQIPEAALVFGVFGALTPDKRIPQVLDAFAALLPYAPGAHLLLAGATAEHYDVEADVRRRGLAPRVTITGYLESEAALTGCIAACDVALSLRWPTAREVSGPWLRALAAGRPTVILDLEHLSDVPSLDPRTWRLNPGTRARVPSPGFQVPNPKSRIPSPGSQVPNPKSRIPGHAPVAVALDIMDEDHSLRLAMRRLAADAGLRATLGAAGRAWWQVEHSPAGMLEDYRAILAAAAAAPVPRPAVPGHLLNDGDSVLRELLGAFDLESPLRSKAFAGRGDAHSLG